MSKNIKKPIKPVRVKRVNIRVYLLILIILPLILQWKTISSQFTGLDDRQIIATNYGFLGDFKNVFKAFEKDNFMSKDGKGYYRPVQTISFMIDTHFGDEKPNAYHFFNILYHLLTVIVLFLLLRKLGVRDNISFYVSLLFSVHPLFTDAIAWIPGRGDILAGLFCAVSFLCFIYYNNTKNKWYFALHSTAFLLALFSKEISVFLPFIIIIYYWFLQKNKYKINELISFIFVWSFSICLFFYLRHIYLNNQDLLSFNAFIRNLPVIPIFLSKLVFPLSLSVMPLYDILFAVIGLILFISTGIYLWKMKAGNKFMIIFGFMWFLVFIIPPMFAALIFAKVHSDYLECRVYLPAIGIFISLGIVLSEIIKGTDNNILMKIFIPVIIIFSFISYNYSDDFQNGITFYSSLIKSNPENANALSQRGSEYLIAKNYDLALEDLDNSIKSDPTVSDPYFNKGLIYHFMDDHEKAEHFLSLALKYDTLYPESANLHAVAFVNLSSEKLTLKKYDDVKAILKVGIKKYPDNFSMHNNLGLAYYAEAKYDSALNEYNNAIKMEWNEFTYFNNRGMAEFNLKDYYSALNDFNKAMELNPGFVDACANRGMVKFKLNDFEGAINDLTSAINANRRLAAAWYFRSLAYARLNKPQEARNDYAEAEKLGFKAPANEK